MGAAPSSPIPTPTPTPTPISGISSTVLNSTNFYRQQFGNVPAVTWNTTLASYAQTWGAKCVFQHSGGPYGENLAAGWPSLSTQSGVELWGNEYKQYNFSNPGFSSATGHFTQLVWKTSVQVGCAKVSCTNTASNGINGGDFLVCEYYPPGNYLGQFQQNVLPQTTKRDVDDLHEDYAEDSLELRGETYKTLVDVPSPREVDEHSVVGRAWEA